jgi:uncharacterized membrane protein YhaH (DUF805 family)
MLGLIVVVLAAINISQDDLRIGLIALAVAAFLLTVIVVAIKRLHDRNKSGWWLTLLFGVPILLNAGAYSVVSDEPLYLTVPALLINLWVLVELGFLRGSRGPNRFGEDPIGGTELPPALPVAQGAD